MNNRFQLYFGPLSIGEISDCEADWPWVSGSIAFDSKFLSDDSEPAARIKTFRLLTIREEQLSRVSDTVDNAAELDAVYAEEEKYTDLIESDEWYVVDCDTGKRTQICCPSYADDDAITWR